MLQGEEHVSTWVGDSVRFAMGRDRRRPPDSRPPGRRHVKVLRVVPGIWEVQERIGGGVIDAWQFNTWDDALTYACIRARGWTA